MNVTLQFDSLRAFRIVTLALKLPHCEVMASTKVQPSQLDARMFYVYRTPSSSVTYARCLIS